jgi:oxygen-dependent protoporphyrinogen oxidase
VPAGFALLAPGRRQALLTSPLLGWRGKLRALGEPFVAADGAGPDGDESVAAFVRRRWGAELLERVVEPIVGAIWMADVERLSLGAAFPRFRELERAPGGVARALRRRAPGADAPAVVGLESGLGALIDALVARLPPAAVRTAARVEALARDGDEWSLEVAGGGTHGADAVIVATPAPAAAALLDGLDAALAAELRAIAYASCDTVYLAWRREALARPSRRLGFFVPRRSGVEAVAAGFLDVKFPGRAPAGRVVARLFFGGAARPAAPRSDAERIDSAVALLGPLLGAREAPEWSLVFRHPGAIPQPAVGHPARVARLRERLAARPGLELAGGPTGAYGLPDAIAAGEAAAERLFESSRGAG